MSITEINQNFRNFSFLALGVLMPFSTAAISIFMILLIILTLLDNTTYQKISHNLKTPLFQSFVMFFILHMVGFYWLEVESINWHKSWMIWFIPILAVAVDKNTARKGVYAFVIGMMLAELYVYYNIFSIWDEYLKGRYGDFLLPISHISYNPFLAISIGLLMTTLLAGQYKNLRLIVAIIFLMTMVANMFMTGGRAGHAGFIFIWLVLSFYYLKKNTQSLYGMVISLILIVLIAWNTSPVFKKRAQQGASELISYQMKLNDASGQISKNLGSVGKRLHFNQYSFEIFKEKPLYGFGTGSFENEWIEYAKDKNHVQNIVTNPHSNHMLILVQFGLLGLVVYLNMFYQQIRVAISMPKGYEFRAMAIVLPLFFILISFYDSYLWGHHTQALFAYLSAIFYRSDLIQKSDGIDIET